MAGRCRCWCNVTVESAAACSAPVLPSHGRREQRHGRDGHRVPAEDASQQDQRSWRRGQVRYGCRQRWRQRYFQPGSTATDCRASSPAVYRLHATSHSTVFRHQRRTPLSWFFSLHCSTPFYSGSGDVVMAINFVVKIGEIGGLSFIRRLGIPNSLEYRRSDLKRFISDDLATLPVTLAGEHCSNNSEV